MEASAGYKAVFEPAAISAVVCTDPELAWAGLTPDAGTTPTAPAVTSSGGDQSGPTDPDAPTEFTVTESGLAINVMYALDEGGKRAVGFKLSDGMDVPEELESRFKFARQKSKLAGTIRGSYFVIKNEY